MLFLIEYERERGHLVSLRTFDDAHATAASDARLELELALSRAGIAREIVVLEAASEEGLHRTHRRYFVGLAELAAATEPSATDGR